MYKKEYVQTFLEKQGQLFDEPVAEDFEEAEEFLEDLHGSCAGFPEGC